MDIEKVSRVLVDWARSKPFITKVYLFGSRITGVSRKTGKPATPGSDLDVAVEFLCAGRDETLLATWILESEGWRKELVPLLGFSKADQLDLQWHHLTETPHMAAYLKDGSRLIYVSIDKWLEMVNGEVMSVFHHLNLFKELNEIILNNQKIKSMDHTLLAWMRQSFTADLVISMGRICDKNKRTKSLVQFLIVLKERQEYLTRDRYVQLYKTDGELLKDIANSDFDKLAGAGENIFHPDKIELDIVRITREDPCGKIISYRDQYIAHSDKDRVNELPTYEELFKAFGIIEDMVKKYNVLIRATSFTKLTPTIQGYWQEVLTVPWLEGAEGQLCENSEPHK